MRINSIDIYGSVTKKECSSLISAKKEFKNIIKGYAEDLMHDFLNDKQYIDCEEVKLIIELGNEWFLKATFKSVDEK